MGKVWQVTACDSATSHGLAGLLPAHDAATASASCARSWCLTSSVPAGRCAAPSLMAARVQGSFDETCRQLELRHTRTKLRYAWTSDFIERVQGAIFEELWRVVFDRYFSGLAACGGCSTGSYATTTMTGSTEATASAVVPRLRSFGVCSDAVTSLTTPRRRTCQTRFRVWTRGARCGASAGPFMHSPHLVTIMRRL